MIEDNTRSAPKGKLDLSAAGIDCPGDFPWVAPLREALARSPRPEAATRLAEKILGTALPGEEVSIAARLAERPAEIGQKLSRIFYAVCGTAPFLASLFQQHPNWVFELLDDDLERPREREELERLLREQLSRGGGDDPGATLRLFKYYELARLSIRDSCEDWVALSESGVTLSELSDLADTILSRALEIAAEQTRASLGPPRWRDQEGGTVELSFCVLGLGKLGSGELNYSSDVDLVYVYETPPVQLAPTLGPDVTEGFAKLAPTDYFTRLAQRYGKLVSDPTALRFLYRIDLDLRPQGAQGNLVVSGESLATYYEAWADTWERAAFMKARPVAGDLELGWRVIRIVDPMIYRSTMDYAGVESIRAMKDRVEEVHGGGAHGFNVKIDSGGIRDVEFVAQAEQMLHGGRIPQIRDRSTQRSLEKLGEVGLLPSHQVDALLDAYRFLRRVENRIQMEDERQSHVVPADGDDLTRLARSMGMRSDDPRSQFETELQRQREAVQGVFRDTCSEGGKARILELFGRSVPHLVKLPSTRAMIESLAEQLARGIDNSPEPGRSLNSLDRFIASIGERRFYYELLLDRPELVPRLTSLFASSQYLSNYLARYPRLIERLFADPDVLLLSVDALRAEFEATLRSLDDGTRDSMEVGLDALRIFQHCQVLNIGLLDIAGKTSPEENQTGLSEIAEVCLVEALGMAERALLQSRGEVSEAAREGAYLIVGMGKLGSYELTYGSDLDLIFLYDVPGTDVALRAEAQNWFVTLTQRLISVLQTPTSEGVCYEIDARLRPSGNQGALVTSIDAFRRYHRESAAVWERQTLLRARPVAGDTSLAEQFAAARVEILERPFSPGLAQEVDEVRQRMETELGSETPMRRNFKTGRGGILDIETVVQYLQLRHGREHPVLFEVDRVENILDQLAERGLLSPDAAATLREGWEFLQRLASRLRVVENRSITDLDSERGDLEGLARRLGYDPSGRERSARRSLLVDYQHHTEGIRRVYEEILRSPRES